MNDHQKELLTKVLGAFAGEHVRLEDLNPEDDLAKRGQQFSDFFTRCVATFKVWPDPHIALLANHIWDVFHNKHVQLCIGPQLSSLHLAIVPPQFLAKLNLPVGVDHRCLVFAPPTWTDLIKEDPIMQMGGVLFVGSQSVDFYNGRHLIDPKALGARAAMYESRFLKTMPPEKLNGYQKSLITKYKGEIDTSLTYERRPVAEVS